MAIEIKYKDTTIAIEAGKTATLHTSGQMLTEDMVISVPEGSGGSQPQLYAPTLKVLGKTLNIEENSNNGIFTNEYDIFIDGEKITTIAKAQVE